MALTKRWIIESLRPGSQWDIVGSVVGPRTSEEAVQKAARTIPQLPQDGALRAIDWELATGDQRDAAAYEDQMNGLPTGGATADAQLVNDAEYEQGKRKGLAVLGGVIVGLVLLFVLFRPTLPTLLLSLVVFGLGFHVAFKEARSGRLLNARAVPSQPGRGFFYGLPNLVFLGIVLSSLVSGHWTAAIANVLFYFAGAAAGIAAASR